jgi:hypothetical protein
MRESTRGLDTFAPKVSLALSLTSTRIVRNIGRKTKPKGLFFETLAHSSSPLLNDSAPPGTISLLENTPIACIASRRRIHHDGELDNARVSREWLGTFSVPTFQRFVTTGYESTEKSPSHPGGFKIFMCQPTVVNIDAKPINQTYLDSSNQKKL